jgi:hypothetical protein
MLMPLAIVPHSCLPENRAPTLEALDLCAVLLCALTALLARADAKVSFVCHHAPPLPPFLCFSPSFFRLFPLFPFLDPTNSTSPPPSAGDGDGSCADGTLEAEDGSNFCDQLAANGTSDCGALAECGFAQEDIDLVESVCVATCGICTSTGMETDTCVLYHRFFRRRSVLKWGTYTVDTKKKIYIYIVNVYVYVNTSPSHPRPPLCPSFSLSLPPPPSSHMFSSYRRTWRVCRQRRGDHGGDWWTSRGLRGDVDVRARRLCFSRRPGRFWPSRWLVPPLLRSFLRLPRRLGKLPARRSALRRVGPSAKCRKHWGLLPAAAFPGKVRQHWQSWICVQ